VDKCAIKAKVERHNPRKIFGTSPYAGGLFKSVFTFRSFVQYCLTSHTEPDRPPVSSIREIAKREAGQMSKKRRFLRLDAVEERIGLRKATIYAKAARGEFPQSRKIG